MKEIQESRLEKINGGQIACSDATMFYELAMYFGGSEDHAHEAQQAFAMFTAAIGACMGF